jgi:hypothetical protein
VWSYVGGPLITNNNGKYGTKGVAAPANIPGSRTGAGSWIDNDGNFWLFAGAQTTSHATLRNDLWKYVPDPDCPAISCKKLSEAGDDDFVISHAGLNNQWIVDVNKNETADLVTGITFENGIRIYPNPTTGNFIVEFDYAQYPYLIDQVTITIYNLIGQPVFSSTEKNTRTHLKKEIDLTNFESGVYFLDLSLKASEKTNAVAIKKKLILSR